MIAALTASLLGQPVTVWPHVSRGTGESRDTEPGLQPWTAEFAGFDDDGNPQVVEATDGRVRSLKGELTVTKHGLRIGRP